MISKSAFTCLCFTIMVSPLFSQTEVEEKLLEEQGEKTASELLERLESLRNHPLNLNTATFKKLLTFPLLSPVQARMIILDRSQNGPFQSVANFRRRLNIDEDLWGRLSPYITISIKKPKKQNFIQLRWRHQTRLPKSSGYQTGKYLGSAWKGYQRVVLSMSHYLRGGLLIEKDPGEIRWNDHYVGYIETNHIPGLSKLLVGNFRIEVGQGLVLWGPYGLSKGANPLSPAKKHSRGIIGYTYADENNYLTGTAVETKIRNIRMLFLASRTPLDATLNSDGTVKSLPASGFHRTASEIDKKDRLHETVYGGRLTSSWSWGTIGVTGWWNRYSKRINKLDHTRYRFDFQGNHNSVIGLDCDLYSGRFNFSGEIVRSKSKGWALIANSIADLGKTSFVISFRRFDPDFQNPHSHSFGSSQVNNEEGFYLGFTGKITPSTRVSIYYDLFRKPWRTYFTPVPTRGDDLLAQLEQKCSKSLTVTFRARFRRGETMGKGEAPSGRKVDILQNRIHGLFRCELQFRPTTRLRLRTRLETTIVSYPEMGVEITCPSHKETGLLLYQDIRVRLISQLTVSARWITFDTDSYDSRIYEFENDLPGVLTIRPLYGKGNRWYLLLRWETFRILRLTAKFISTLHEGVTYWGSGHDRIDGNADKEFRVQADLRL